MQPDVPAFEPRAAERARRIAFWLTACVAAMVHWIPHFPPQIDLAQHAGQLRMLRDWTEPDFRYRDILELNFFTPYLPAYLIGALLTFVMSAVTAVKLLWTLSAIGTVSASVYLRRVVGGDAAWDWLLLPGLFGVTFQWGFLTFLLAVPFALLFVAFWHGYLRAPARSKAVSAAAALLLLFFAHALVTAWTMTACGLMLLGDVKPSLRALWQRMLRGIPLLAPLPLAILWRASSPQSTQPQVPVIWDWSERYLKFLPQWIGTNDRPLATLLGVSLLVLPFAAGARLSRDPVRRAPLMVTLLVLLLVPHWLFDVAFTYNRFFTLLAPTLIVALAASDDDVLRKASARWALPLVTGAYVLVVVARMMTFATEQRPFVQLVQSMEPGRHVLSIVEQPFSSALNVPSAYIHFPVWYQAEKGGFVEPNFADYLPMIVRFRADYVRPVPRQFEFNASAATLDARVQRFEEVLLRSTGPTPPSVPDGLTLLAHQGQWWLYSTGTVRAIPSTTR